MSLELKNYYSKKQRKMAFYIVENDLNNKENPPELSALVGLESEFKIIFYPTTRKPLEKPAMQTGIVINRDVNSNKEIAKIERDRNLIVRRVTKKNSMYCPNLPTQWRNNSDVTIPKAEFGFFSNCFA